MSELSITNQHLIEDLNLQSNPPLGGSLDISLFTQLKNFKASNNQINRITGLKHLSNLEDIDVSNNIISNPLEPVYGNVDLKKYKVNNNNISGTIPEFVNNELIEEINLSNNDLFGNLPFLHENVNLTKINLSNNSIGNKPNVQRILIDLTKKDGFHDFEVGDRIFQIQPFNFTLYATIFSIKDGPSTNEKYLFVGDFSDTTESFEKGTNYSRLYKTTEDQFDIEQFFTVTWDNSTNDFLIDGIKNKTLNLLRGKKYKFKYPAGHKIKFTEELLTNPNEFTQGIIDDTSANEITLIVPFVTPPKLNYYEENNVNAGGIIRVKTLKNQPNGLLVSHEIQTATFDANIFNQNVKDINLSNNSLSSAILEEILEEIDNYSTANGVLQIQNNAPIQSGSSNIFVTSLQSRGWTVTFDI